MEEIIKEIRAVRKEMERIKADNYINEIFRQSILHILNLISDLFKDKSVMPQEENLEKDLTIEFENPTFNIGDVVVLKSYTPISMTIAKEIKEIIREADRSISYRCIWFTEDGISHSEIFPNKILKKRN